MPAVRENPEKWARNSASAGPSYKEGALNPRREWESSAVEAEGLYESGITAAIADKRFSKGIEKVGNVKYEQGIKEKGVQRYTQTVVLPSSKAAYKKGFDPFADAIRGVDLPPRGPKGQNLERVRAIQDALMAEKASQF